MVGALWTGISGLSGSQIGLDNESNNIANVNTVGYKSSRISFADQMYQDKIGKGVTSFDVEKMYTQGNLKVTGVSYDMALSGDGFYQLSDGKDTYYSRAGNFRMGESGTLQDVGANNVQGWAMAPIGAEDITSTDANSSYFTNTFSKLLGNKIIRDTTTVETIIAKATDYNATAVSDNSTIYSGADYKSASTKIGNVEALITEYNAALTVYSEADPKPTASISYVQKDKLDFDLDNATSVLAAGDEIYAFIDGVKYSQSFDTDEATTIKKFVDALSDTTGFKARLVDTATGLTDPSGQPEVDTSSASGEVVLESMIPGVVFRVTEFGWTDASASNQKTKGALTNLQAAVKGTGTGHITSIRDALADAVAGKQSDVYSLADLDPINADMSVAVDWTYSIDVYDKDLGDNVTVPLTPLAIPAAADVDAMVTAINTTAGASAVNTELAFYVKAYNINGSLVVKTLDSNSDVEFTGSLIHDTAGATAKPNELIPRNPNNSGREGAGAEFMEIQTVINQTASKSDLQLRLDTLMLTDSAFGEFSVDESGLITMQQDGALFAIGQVAIAQFTDNRGLDPQGDNLLKETTRSGSALFNVNNERTAIIKGGTLELSTSELSESLVNLMVFQRAFEANAKSITTADQILTTLIQLKR
ncbi:MAG: flagellar hook-basal body complex protein [Campylobacterota bacterium]|nr:flagellar hook-basal body complex protein [Campylobacterota bacterium]